MKNLFYPNEIYVYFVGISTFLTLFALTKVSPGSPPTLGIVAGLILLLVAAERFLSRNFGDNKTSLWVKQAPAKRRSAAWVAVIAFAVLAVAAVVVGNPLGFVLLVAFPAVAFLIDLALRKAFFEVRKPR